MFSFQNKNVRYTFFSMSFCNEHAKIVDGKMQCENNDANQLESIEWKTEVFVDRFYSQFNWIGCILWINSCVHWQNISGICGFSPIPIELCNISHQQIQMLLPFLKQYRLQITIEFLMHIQSVLIGFYIFFNAWNKIRNKKIDDKNLFLLMAENNAISFHWFGFIQHLVFGVDSISMHVFVFFFIFFSNENDDFGFCCFYSL